LVFAVQAFQEDVAVLRALVQARERTIAEHAQTVHVLRHQMARKDLELAALRVQVQASALATPAPQAWRAAVALRLRAIVALVHPDKWHGNPVAPVHFHAFSNLEENVRQQIQKVTSHPWIPKQIPVRGFVYDVKTGRLKEVST
jgi:hypothetical protein